MLSSMITLVMKWTVSFYDEKVAKETKQFPKGILVNFLHITEMIVY